MILLMSLSWNEVAQHAPKRAQFSVRGQTKEGEETKRKFTMQGREFIIYHNRVICKVILFSPWLWACLHLQSPLSVVSTKGKTFY
jgi:hypothetical protein